MPAIGRNTKSVQLAQLTDAQIQARWAALLPKFVMGLIISATVTVGVFGLNHLLKPSQRITDIATVVFQISAIFAVCFGLLSAAACFFRSDAWKKKAH